MIDNVSLKYTGSNNYTLRELDLQVKKGEIVVIKGDNGSGKSTLLKTILRIHRPGTFSEQTGSIQVKNGEQIGYVHQRPNTQILTFRVDEEIATPLSYRKFPRELRREKVKEALEKYSIVNLKNRDPHRISAGQQQITSIITNLIHNASLLLLDEPFALLDKINQDLLIEKLKIAKEKGIGIILVTHQNFLVKTLSDRIYSLTSGCLKEEKFSKLLPPLRDNPAEDIGNYLAWKNISMGYSEPILNFPSLKLNLDNPVVCIGKNGSGKTLFLLTLAGLVSPITGEILRKKRFWKKRGKAEEHIPDVRKTENLRKRLYIPQDSDYFFREATIKEEWEKYTPRQLPQKYKEKEALSPYTLSEGEAKQFCLEIASEHQGTIILDEPSYALDQNGLRLLLSLLRQNKWVVFSTNDRMLLSAMYENEIKFSIIDLENFLCN